MTVEQFLPAFHYGDAIGNSTLSLHNHLLEQGIESRVIAMTIDENMRDQAEFFEDYTPNPDSIKILHFAIPSQLTDFFIDAPGKKVMVYHNITPPHFFTDFSDNLARFTQEGRNHLARLKDTFDLSIADSSYNAGELEELGYQNVRVFPIMIKLDDYAGQHSKPFYNLYDDERSNIIFVGRITPNKKIEDLVKTVFFYKKYINPSIRLIVAGKTDTLPKYFFAVRDLASRFLLTSDDIVFTGHIPFDELLAVYQLGDVFLSMSEHEGFCLPLIESCFLNVPVAAYNAGAVKETLGDGGIVFNEKRYEDVAALLDNMIHDNELNQKIKSFQKQRIKDYKQSSKPELFHQILKEL